MDFKLDVSRSGVEERQIVDKTLRNCRHKRNMRVADRTCDVTFRQLSFRGLKMAYFHCEAFINI